MSGTVSSLGEIRAAGAEWAAEQIQIARRFLGEADAKRRAGRLYTVAEMETLFASAGEAGFCAGALWLKQRLAPTAGAGE